MATRNPLQMSAGELAAEIRQGDMSSVDVVSLHLRQIERLNPLLCAVVQLSTSALAEAQRADAILAEGGAVGPLHGVPFTVKDWIETEGIVCAAGYQKRRNFVPQADAPVVARLRQAGGILLGKTKTGSTADLHPAPKNPHRLNCSPGASSGGEAAIIAAHGSPLGIGSDSGGSLRWPAHCCGIATLKPTPGLVPLTGHFPPIIPMSDPRTVIGPMARSVADLALAMSIIAGEDGRDASALPVPLGDPSAVAGKGLRIAFFTGFPGVAADAATTAVVREAVRVFAERGAAVAEACPPDIERAMDITKAYWSRPESMSEQSWRPWGESTLAADAVERSLFEWDRLRRRFLGFMQRFDLVVCPVASQPAPERREATVDDYAFTVPFSLTGYPSAVVRMGTSADGLPIGVQVVAKPFRDHIALAGAAILEASTGPWPSPAMALS